MDQDGSLDQLSEWAWVSVTGIDTDYAGRRGRLGNGRRRGRRGTVQTYEGSQFD